jgi:H+/gluconate symporter-like permease
MEPGALIAQETAVDRCGDYRPRCMEVFAAANAMGTPLDSNGLKAFFVTFHAMSGLEARLTYLSWTPNDDLLDAELRSCFVVLLLHHLSLLPSFLGRFTSH